MSIKDYRGREIVVQLAQTAEEKTRREQARRSGMLPPTKQEKAITRRRFTSGIKFYDLAYFVTGSTWDTVDLSVGGPLVREAATWASLADAFNFPLSIDPAQWKTKFRTMDTPYVMTVNIFDAEFNSITEKVDLSGASYKLPDMAPGPPSFINFTNTWPTEDPRAYYEGGLFTDFAIAGFDLFGYYWTNTPDPDAAHVTPSINLDAAIDVFMPPAAIRVTGEYFPQGGGPGGGGSGPGSSAYQPMPYPQFTGNFFLLDPMDCPGTGVVYYRIVAFPPGLQFSLLPTGGVQPPFIVCGLTGPGADGEYANFSPDKDEYNSPYVFWDRANVFDNYLEGDREDDDEALRERMVAIMRLQGGDNIERRGGIWSLGTDRDNMNNSRVVVAGGTGTTPALLSGAIFQGGTRWFRWKIT